MNGPSTLSQVAGLVLFVLLVLAAAAVHRMVLRRRASRAMAAQWRAVSHRAGRAARVPEQRAS